MTDAPRPQLLPSGEWVGGTLSTPFIIEEGGQRQRARLAIWYELPADKIVGQKIFMPGEDAGEVLATLLREAFRAPAHGAPRRPAAIRMSQEDLLPSVREVVGEEMIVRLDDAPELDEILESMTRAMAEPDSGARRRPSSLLAGDKHPDDLVEDLFRAGQMLHAIAPWERIGEDEPLRLDIDALDLHGACLVVIGVLGKSRGLLIFPSLEHYARFEKHCSLDPGHLPDDVGTPLWSFTLDHIGDLPDEFCEEFAAHGRDPIDGDSYPVLESRDGHSMPLDLTDRDIRIAAAAAYALGSFVVRCGDQIARGISQSESYANNNGPVVRLTHPYESLDEFEAVPEGEGYEEASRRSFDEETDWLAVEGLVESRGVSVDFMYGVLTAAASHPSMSVGPSAWLPWVLGPDPLAGGEDPQTVMSLIMDAYNSIVDDLERGEVTIPGVDESDELGAWCQGYARTIAADAAWIDDDTARELMAPILGLAGEELDGLDPEKIQSFLDSGGPAIMEDIVLEAHEHFREMRLEEMRQRRTPARKGAGKVGRNDPCPCGSGKKYKKCCWGG